MSRPLEGTYGLYLWEVGGSTSEPTDTGRRGSLEEMNEAGSVANLDQLKGIRLELGGREITMAGYVVRPVPEEGATDGE